MKILILGGAGFVGGNLALHLCTSHAPEGGCHEVMVLDNFVRKGSENNLERFDVYDIPVVRGDTRNTEDLFPVFESFKPDVVLDCSAQTTAVAGYENPMFDFTNNTLATINILEACRKYDCGLIFWSSNKTYSGDKCNALPMKELVTRFVWDHDAYIANDDGWVKGWHPLRGINEEFDIWGTQHSIYGATKLASEVLIAEYADVFKIPAIINRCSCLAGPHQFGFAFQGWVHWMVEARMTGQKIQVDGFGGKQVRDVLHIDDLCNLIEKQVIEVDRGQYYGEVFNIGGGPQNTISVLEALLYITEKLEQGDLGASFSDVPRRADQKIYISDISKATKYFGWIPKRDPKQTIDDIIEWLHQE